ncbi:hypothetical protein NEMIN01_1171 [Nematocida minor]|uniref:uncharacterized protein n=1 Tax=Nematocida minor TaxID=1912983 RepID=UPI00221F21F6|nr:uncharacterized protein NEMIN01_1171 [Nematocida minor]KAI5190706.1 hypothetical protein NEMIN01_1171 [Nematocida minor]
MDEETRVLSFKRTLIDEIAVGETLPNARKLKRIDKVFKDFRTSELDNKEPQTPLTFYQSPTEEERNNSWRHVDFFPNKEHIKTEGSTTTNSGDYPFLYISLNKTPVKGAPYVLYSTDGYKYYIRKERAKDNTDAYGTIKRDVTPEKIGLYKNLALFLDRDNLDLVESDKMSKFTISLPNALDVAIPEKGMSAIPVLRDLEEVRAISTKKMYLDRVDMATGKIDNYILQCKDFHAKFKRIANTWHPQQYICTSHSTASIVDLREKVSNVFWYSKDPKLVIERAGFKRQHKAEKGLESKIHITSGKTLGTFDMRNLSTIYGEYNTFVNLGVLSVSRNIAVYNSYGHFYFQNSTAPENNVLKLYKFNAGDKFIGFDWCGGFGSHPYTMAAFLFHNRLNIYCGDGSTMVHEIKPDKFITGPPESTERIKNIMKKGEGMKMMVETKTRAKKEREKKVHKTYSLLERSLLNGFRDPLETDKGSDVVTEPTNLIGKVIGYTKLIDFVSMQEKAAIKNKNAMKEQSQADSDRNSQRNSQAQ